MIALLGAESTGKSTLAVQLRDALAQQGQSVSVVTEYLREFCDARSRTPLRNEQAAIAAEQALRIERAAALHDWVVADTTALMVAVYSDLIFNDTGLYATALQAQSRYAVHLLTAIDLPWQADGHQRDGAHVQGPVDARLRQALAGAGLVFSVVCGRDSMRLASALAALPAPRPAPADATAPQPRWQAACERCGDPACERHRWPRG